MLFAGSPNTVSGHWKPGLPGEHDGYSNVFCWITTSYVVAVSDSLPTRKRLMCPFLMGLKYSWFAFLSCSSAGRQRRGWHCRVPAPKPWAATVLAVPPIAPRPGSPSRHRDLASHRFIRGAEQHLSHRHRHRVQPGLLLRGVHPQFLHAMPTGGVQPPDVPGPGATNARIYYCWFRMRLISRVLAKPAAINGTDDSVVIALVQTQCIPCPAGAFCDGPAMTSFEECPAGFFQVC